MRLVIISFVSCAASFTFAQKTSSPNPERTRYDIKLDVDFDARRYTGTERVRYFNRSERATSVLYFRLYPNARPTKAQRAAENDELPQGIEIKPFASSNNNSKASDEDQTSKDKRDNGKTDDKVYDVEEARLEIVAVRSATGQPLAYSLDESETMLRVNLNASLAGASSVEIEIDFRGAIPEIDAEETGLLAHIVQQVDAALRDRREVRRAREVHFMSRGVMLLGMSYPVLAVREAGEWRRDKLSVHVGRAMHTEAADYAVTMAIAPNVKVFASAPDVVNFPSDEQANAFEKRATVDGKIVHRFGGTQLRNFAFIAGRSLKALEASIAGVTVRSIYLPEHETTARRALIAGREAVRIFSNRFGNLPAGSQVNIAEAPLVAGRGSAKFAGLGVIASAFYVDFDSAAVRSLPEIVREQRTSVEDSLEWAIAQTVAHQWWGACVGSDPVREPVLDESLTQFSALTYYRVRYGEERARLALEDQLRGVYVIYRTVGGEDAPADREAADYRNTFQFAALVSGKGALMLEALRTKMGDVAFYRALANFYETMRFKLAGLDDLRAVFAAETAPEATFNRRLVARHFNRWLSERHGDEDIAPPNTQLAATFGVNPTQTTNANTPRTTAPQTTTTDERTPAARNRFARLGIFFWKQMTRIR
ncbi:MAG: hypothetical protein MSG64_20215 [Pyrinomonadaceae bacterium MAG19_C2-C3]|nr:hypothetical protein [Pyrinomonadaceae bacterium MAG19_C2-C3]